MDSFKGGSEELGGKIALQVGKRYQVVVETAHLTGGAGCRFYWKPPGAEKRDVIKNPYLFTR